MHKDSGAPLEVNLTIGFQEERVLVRQDLYDTDDSIDERESGYYIAETSPFIATDKNVNTGDA
jgi:hypothetical protein